MKESPACKTCLCSQPELVKFAVTNFPFQTVCKVDAILLAAWCLLLGII